MEGELRVVEGGFKMEVGFIVKWTQDDIRFAGRTFRIVRFEFRDGKLVAICELESGQLPVLGHLYAPTIPEGVDYVFELDELEVLP